MVTLQEVEKQLHAIGVTNRYWGRAEIVELQHILVPGERIHACLNGRYHGGFATFVVTDQRLLLVDKKPFYLTVEDMRYDMISEVDFGAQLLKGTLRVCTPSKTLIFTAYRPQILRQASTFIQQLVMQIRQHPGISPQLNQPVAINAPEPAPVQPQPVSTQPLNGLYTVALGNQAINAPETPASTLPSPHRRNPYMNPPFIVRRRVGRFGPVSRTN